MGNDGEEVEVEVELRREIINFPVRTKNRVRADSGWGEMNDDSTRRKMGEGKGGTAKPSPRSKRLLDDRCALSSRMRKRIAGSEHE